MSDYKKLKVWETAHKFTIDIYKITKGFPEDEKYGLISQIRRSVSSISTNIVEGCGQLGNGNLIRFLGIARGSAFEVEYQLLLSKDLGYININEFSVLNERIKSIIRMINNLIKSLKNLKLKTENRRAPRKLYISYRVKVPAGQGLANHPYRVLH
jgi:four helix bundle protein